MLILWVVQDISQEPTTHDSHTSVNLMFRSCKYQINIKGANLNKYTFSLLNIEKKVYLMAVTHLMSHKLRKQLITLVKRSYFVKTSNPTQTSLDWR